MAFLICVDMGTSNTRIYLTDTHCIIDKIKYPIGAYAGLLSKDSLIRTLRDGIFTLISRNNLKEDDIQKILASGMITCESGICLLKHIKAPCSITDLAKNMHECVIEEISKIPFLFIRGIITDTNDLTDLDMMRGEETELLGLTDKAENNCLYVLLGTHSKMIRTDRLGRITEIKTALSGDMISAITEQTILKNSVSLKAHNINIEYLIKGYECAKDLGISGALFKVRIIDKVLGVTQEACYNFFLGAIFQGEIQNIIKTSVQKVVISGKKELRSPFSALLSNNTDKEIIEIEDSIADNATALGAMRLYQEYIKLNK